MFFENKKAMGGTLVVSLALACIGIGAWVYQLVYGMQVTGLSNTMVWGLTVAVFFALMAGGAGLLALAGFSEFFGFMSAEQRQRSLLVSFAAIMAGGVIIVMDLGSPAKLMHLITSLNVTSFSVLDFWFFAATALVSAVYFFLVRADKNTKAVGVLAIAVSIGLIAVEGMLMTNNISHHLWASSMSVVTFLAGSFLAGSALLTLLVPELKRFFLVALVVSATITLAEVTTSLLVGTALSRATMLSIVAGSFSVYFYFHVLVGLVIPFILLLKTRQITAASVCAILGLASEKLWFLVAGEAEVMEQYHHIGAELPKEIFGYLPTIVEVAISIGVVAIGVALVLIVTMLFNKSSMDK